MISLTDLKVETQAIVVDIVERSGIKKGQVFVLGLSSSEVLGAKIGKIQALKLVKLLSKPF